MKVNNQFNLLVGYEEQCRDFKTRLTSLQVDFKLLDYTSETFFH